MAEKVVSGLPQQDLEREKRLRSIDRSTSPSVTEDYEARFLRALPLLENTVLQNPHISSNEFGERVAVISAQFGLSRRQESLVYYTFGLYVRDTFDVEEYRDRVYRGNKNENPLVDIATDETAFDIFLRDIGVQPNRMGIIDTGPFILERRIPSCFIVHAYGDRRTILQHLGEKADYTGLGYFIQRWDKDKLKKLSTEQRQRIELLEGKVMVVLHDGKDKVDEKRTREHELRHYLFNLYFRDRMDTANTLFLLDLAFRNELYAYYHSDLDPHITVKHITPDDFVQRPIEVQDRIMQDVYRALYELKRLELVGYKGNQYIAKLALVSHGLPDFAFRLQQIQPYDGVRKGRYVSPEEAMLQYVQTPKSEEDLALNLAWYRAAIRRMSSATMGKRRRDHILRTYVQSAGSHFVRYVGESREAVYSRTGPCVEALSSLAALLPAGQERLVDEQIERLQKRLAREREQEKEEIDWKAFLSDLRHRDPVLFARYEALRTQIGRTRLYVLADFRDRYLQDLYEEWIRQREEQVG